MGSSSKKSVPEIPAEETHLVEPISYYRSQTGVYPSNAETWWSYRRPPEIGTKEPPKQYLEVFDPSLRHQITIGNARAPRGHYIFNVFHKDRALMAGVSGVAVESAGSLRPTCVAFFAGRVFYAGVNSIGFSTKVYFSQIVERVEQIQNCYQELDPTSEEIRDLLPSDGGVIVIPEVSEVLNLFPMGMALYVFAKNGVWQISGSVGTGFKANDYSVVKISGIPTISNMSFVSVEGAPIWWNYSGIYTLAPNETGQIAVKNLTEATIQGYFDSIPASNKLYAKGAYDPIKQRVQWLFRQAAIVTQSDNYKYDTILNLDTQSGAWYPYEGAENSRIELLGVFTLEGFTSVSNLVTVLSGTDTVLSGLEEVVIDENTFKSLAAKIKYIVNILEDTVGIPVPPEPAPPVQIDVYVSSDQVLVDLDVVYIIGV